MMQGDVLVARVQRRERAARRARSVPLLTVAVALGVLAWAHAASSPQLAQVELLTPLATFSVIWLAMAAQRQLSGAGWGRDGYGVVLAILVAAVVVPLGLIAPMFVGAELFLGLGLVVLGWRGRDRELWIPGLVLVAVGPFVHLNGADNTVGVLVAAVTAAVVGEGSERSAGGGLADPSALTVLLTAAGFAAMAVRAALAERRTTRIPVLPEGETASGMGR
ncbi:hypothetical protein [Cellulosimicrobium cellulans]|uniref:hypothetical protein n=1 Tax=Cellulosimicrobium cellulans TaxID=1710 RepID=UPI00130DF214|nr:hypothetical protein [Cellulosimicrobium cellulans]